VTGAKACSIDNAIGFVSCSGTRVVTPAQSTTYTLTASAHSGMVKASATVSVTP
jgi:hypothetical protein